MYWTITSNREWGSGFKLPIERYISDDQFGFDHWHSDYNHLYDHTFYYTTKNFRAGGSAEFNLPLNYLGI
jgi:hypothetical protein